VRGSFSAMVGGETPLVGTDMLQIRSSTAWRLRELCFVMCVVFQSARGEVDLASCSGALAYCTLYAGLWIWKIRGFCGQSQIGRGTPVFRIEFGRSTGTPAGRGVLHCLLKQ